MDSSTGTSPPEGNTNTVEEVFGGFWRARHGDGVTDVPDRPYEVRGKAPQPDPLPIHWRGIKSIVVLEVSLTSISCHK